MTNKAPGRVGDSPIIGAGTWVENNSCGVSATGHGEYFIRFSVAKEICVKARYQNKSIQQASTEVMNQLKEIGADGGVIVWTAKEITLLHSILQRWQEHTKMHLLR